MPLFCLLWYKDTVQVSDGFGNKRDVLIYHIKLQQNSNFGAGLLGLRGGGDCSIMLEYRIIKNYRVLDKEIHPRYTPLPDMIYRMKWMESTTHHKLFTPDFDIKGEMKGKYYTQGYLHLTWYTWWHDDNCIAIMNLILSSYLPCIK